MAIKASAAITLSSIRDLQSCTRYYLLQSSTLSPPSRPTAKPPGGNWVTAEPSYASGSTNSLYFCDLNVFSDGSFAYSEVSLSSSYEAAKAAFNKAVAAQESVDGLQVGGRNLFINTLYPDVSSAAKYPRLVGQTADTTVRSGLVEAAEHGIRDTVKTAQQPLIVFGSANYASGTMNGLEVGKTYTLSFDYACKLYSAATSGTYHFRAYLFSDDNTGAEAYGNTMVLGLLYTTLITYSTANENYGQERTGHCEWTFTVPLIATRVCIKIQPNSSTASLFAAGDYIEVANLMLVEGNTTTGYAPAPEDLESSISEALDVAQTALSHSEVIVGTQTAKTGNWTGVASFAELRDGQQIAYWLPYAGSGEATLNLTLSGGETTGKKNCYYSGASRLTTQYAAGNMIHLTYRVNANVNGTSYTGWWADANYNSDTYDRIRFNNAITAKAAITAAHIIVGDDSGFFHLAGGVPFDVNKPILYAVSAIAANATGTQNYLSYPSIEVRTTLGNTGWTADKGKTLYLAGTLSGNTYIPLSTNWLTTAPSDESTITYIALGYMYSNHQIYLYPEHPMYRMVDGELRAVTQLAYEAQIAAVAAQATADAARADFKRVVRIDDDGLHVGDNQSSGEVLIDSESVNVVMNGSKYSRFAGNYVQFGNYQLRRTTDGGLAFKMTDI